MQETDRFVSAYKDELCFVVETKQWLEKRETVWAPATQGSLQERALKLPSLKNMPVILRIQISRLQR